MMLKRNERRSVQNKENKKTEQMLRFFYRMLVY